MHILCGEVANAVRCVRLKFYLYIYIYMELLAIE